MGCGKQIGGLFVFVLLCFAAGAVGALFTVPTVAPGGWYTELAKPAWTPPGWVFGPVWTTLYLLMAIAGWLVWRQQRGIPTALFIIQLLLNAAWPVLFFGLRQMEYALLDIGLLWLLVLLTLVSFWRFSRLAAVLFIPYWLWVTFAAILNVAIWRMQAAG